MGVAIDGGNSKTDVAIVRDDGELLALRRGGGSSPYFLGVEGALDVIQALVDDAIDDAGLTTPLDATAVLLAGVDFPAEADAVELAVKRRQWGRVVLVENDMFAILRAGTDKGWGVAVGCGAGINCVGIAPDGRRIRFPAVGWMSGDRGGGRYMARRAVYAAARSEDGRGPATTLEVAVPSHFGLSSARELTEALYFRRLDENRLIEVVPLIFAEAARDQVSAEMLEELAAEVVALARVAISRLGLQMEGVEVHLGGSLLRHGGSWLMTMIRTGLRDFSPSVVCNTIDASPVVGAALFALDLLHAPSAAQARLRREMGVSDAETAFR